MGRENPRQTQTAQTATRNAAVEHVRRQTPRNHSPESCECAANPEFDPSESAAVVARLRHRPTSG